MARNDKIKKGNHVILLNDGHIDLEIKKYEIAENYLRKGVQFGAYNLRNYIDLSKAYRNLGKISEEETLLLLAVDLIEPAVKRAPKAEKPVKLIEAAVIHHRLADVYEIQGELNLSENHLEKEKEYLTEAFNQ